jgi:hypothetical protein
MRIEGLKHTETFEDGTHIHMWNVRLVLRKYLVMPGFSIAIKDKPGATPWAGKGFNRRNDESAK